MMRMCSHTAFHTAVLSHCHKSIYAIPCFRYFLSCFFIFYKFTLNLRYLFIFFFINRMKTDRRKCFMTILGIFQILIGSLFLALALWSVIIVRMALYASGLAPFFLAILVSENKKRGFNIFF